MGIFSVNGYPDELTQYLVEEDKQFRAESERIRRELEVSRMMMNKRRIIIDVREYFGGVDLGKGSDQTVYTPIKNGQRGPS